VDRPQRLADRQEERAAAYYGGRRTPRSGSGDRKGDVETPTELIECKHTQRLSFGLMYRMFGSLMLQALLAHKRPVMEIEYTTPRGAFPNYLVVLDRDDYRSMTVELEELRAVAKEYAAMKLRGL
jgi:hypothetical protein